MRKTFILLLLTLLSIGAVWGQTAVVTTRPAQIDISANTSESAVLMTISAYPVDDVRYRLYSGSNQYNCWDAVTSTYVTSASYGSGPQVPGTPTTSSTWWIMFQRGNNASVSASYRDRLGPTYPSNFNTTALPTATAIVTPASITNSDVTFNTWNSYDQKYVVLAYDSTVGGVLVSATSTALTTGAFDLKIEYGTLIQRIEVRDVTNNLVESVTGSWGSGAPTPTINISGSLSAFSAWTGSPSAAQSYTLSGSNLTGNINVVAPDGFVLSTDESTWTATLSLASTFNGLVYVRMTGATAGEFNGNITHNSTGAAEVTQAVSGTVSDPVPTILPVSNLTAFTTLVGTPSASQQYNLTAAFLTANITITAPAGFEISTDGSNYSAGLSVAPNYNGQIYVRLTGTTAGTFNGNILHSSTGATDVNVAVSGAVTNPAVPTTFLEENFEYTAGTTLVSNGWIAHSGAGTNSPTVAESGLAYPGYYAMSGLAGQTINTGEDVHKNLLEAQTSGSVYNSFLIKVTSATEAGDYVYHYATNADITTDFKAKFFVGRDTSNNVRFGLTKSANIGSAVAWTGYDYALNTTYLVVLKYEIVPGTANDIATAWINPIIGVTEPTPMLSAATTETDIGVLGIGAVGIRQSNASLTAIFDGIRVTNDWDLLWDGTPPPPPALAANPTILDPLASIVGNYSDEFGSYTITSSNLLGQINVVAPEGFVVSTDQTNWSSTLDLAVNFTGTIYVSMYASVSGEYNGNIVHTTAGLDPVNVAVSGEAFNPAVIWNITANLSAFGAEAGTPSAAQSYTLSASNASQNLALETTAPFEISTSQTTGFGTSLSLAPTFNGNIWVRMNAATAGTFESVITHSTLDATPADINISGIATAPAGNYATDLFFSEYIEGSSSNKALEIFNGTGVPVDLGTYKVYLYSNGASAATNTLTFTPGTMLAHGDVYVIANASANATILGLADVTSTVTFFNGDDAISMVKVVNEQEVFVDIIGVIDQDPGTQWTADGGYSTLDKTLVRKPTVTQGITVNPPNPGDNIATAFPTLATEWDVYPIDTLTDLGSHTFAPGMEIAATPVITPASGLYYNPVEVNITAATPGSIIRYTTNGSEPDETSSQYTAPFQVTATSTVKARAYATGFAPSAVAIANYSFPVAVANIAALRAMPTGTTVYQLTGEAILTFQQSTRNQKYIQDATAAIVIDDAAGVITTAYNLYDGITGIAGTLGLYSGLLQFTPAANPGAATSTGNVVVPEVRTLASLTTADQAKLIKVENVMVDATNVNFGTYAENINVTDPTATLVMRTFPATDYSSTAIPTVAQDIICLVGEFSGTMQISPRFLSDFSNHAGGTLEAPIVSISVVGNTINLSWDAVAGATSYRVEGSSDPYGTFTPVTTVTGTAYNGAAEGMKFFKVIAIQ